MKPWWTLGFLGVAACGLFDSEPTSQEPPTLRPLDPGEEASLLVANNGGTAPGIVRVSVTTGKVEMVGPALDVLGHGTNMVRRVWASDSTSRVVVLLERHEAFNRIESALVAGDGGAWRTLARARDQSFRATVSAGLDLVWIESLATTSTVGACEASLMDFSGETLLHLPGERCGDGGLRFVGFPRIGRWAAYAKNDVVAFAGPDAPSAGDVPVPGLERLTRTSTLGSSSLVLQAGDAHRIISAGGTVHEPLRSEPGLLQDGAQIRGRSAAHDPYIKRGDDLYVLREDGSEELAAPGRGVEGVVSGSTRRTIALRHLSPLYELAALGPEGEEAVLDTTAFDDDQHRVAREKSALSQIVDVTSVVDTEARTTVVALVRHSDQQKAAADARIDEHLVMWTAGADGKFETRELVRFTGADRSHWPAVDNHGVAISASGRYITYADAGGAHVLDVESSTDVPLATLYQLQLGPQVTMQ